MKNITVKKNHLILGIIALVGLTYVGTRLYLDNTEPSASASGSGNRKLWRLFKKSIGTTGQTPLYNSEIAQNATSETQTEKTTGEQTTNVN